MFGLLAGISAVATIGSSIASSQAQAAAAAAQEASVRTQSLENDYKISRQKNRDIEQAQMMLEENEMRAGMRGISLQSPSFNAMQVDTLQKAEKAMQLGSSFEQVNQLSSSAQIDSIENAKNSQQIANVFGTAGSLAQIGSQYYVNSNQSNQKNIQNQWQGLPYPYLGGNYNG
jgi:murein L,D-transpeptidase YcbB/YkuD